MFQLPDARYYPSFLGERMQVGMIVNDLEQALTFWTEVMDVGPWIVIEQSLGDREFVHRGEVSPVDMSVAFSYIGETQFELIAQNNDAPSAYREFLEEGREGVQHLAFWPDDYEHACAELERRGFEEVTVVRTADGEKNVSYFAGPPLLGVLIEVIPVTEARRQYVAAMEALARTWDGTRPIRRFASRADFLVSADVASLERQP
ncbi:VOC family protein [Nocardia sp. CA2R105]|uniref:VOC family protein n=1 Tax=Nocardia coffeae TaxID=2873381 RepID=UPI001CA61A83|nr:VOC family protein [Nocardia coffeae]MBY8858675.1 VOC family protein [Nocardia coffeae]